MHHLKRLNAAMSPAAMLVAILALLVAAGGAGYAAGQIGTSGIKNNAITAKKIHKNAVTTKKIKNGAVNSSKVADRSLSNADLAPESGFHGIAGHTQAEGDCTWTEASTLLTGIQPAGYRVTRSGIVHITGLMQWSDAPGGDTECGGADSAEAIEDGTIFTLPTGYRPARPIVQAQDDYTVVIGARSTMVIGGTLSIPAGAVIWIDNSGATGGLANLSLAFTVGGVPGSPAKAGATRSTPADRALLEKLFAQR